MKWFISSSGAFFMGNYESVQQKNWKEINERERERDEMLLQKKLATKSEL